MSELRAPDPTLQALSQEVVCVEVAGRDARVAHHFFPRLCADREIDYTETPQVAAWIAVPCRECFPDAPPPGARQMEDRPPGFWITDRYLAWQVQP